MLARCLAETKRWIQCGLMEDVFAHAQMKDNLVAYKNRGDPDREPGDRDGQVGCGAREVWVKCGRSEQGIYFKDFARSDE